MMSEQNARREMDRRLAQCGWQVQDCRRMNIFATQGVAVREFPLITSRDDYLHNAEAKVNGLVEALPEGLTLAGVETQSDKYLQGFSEIICFQKGDENGRFHAFFPKLE
jgi:type I restriction enzyme R subunit